MTNEKMTVHKALCELKTLDARIQKGIQQNPFVFANKHANSKVAGVNVGDYCKEILASYQSVNDLISKVKKNWHQPDKLQIMLLMKKIWFLKVDL